MDKQDILNRVEDFTAEQLFEFINKGIVTLEELRNTGNLDASKRREIITLQNQIDDKDNEFWAKQRLTLQGCKTYLELFPAGKHLKEAEILLDEYTWKANGNTINGSTEYLKDFPEGNHAEEARNKTKEVQRILDKLERNPNSIPAQKIREYLNNGTISTNTLINIGIPELVIERLMKNSIQPDFKSLGETPKAIPEGFTEVYFWGIRGSGKTTALASVISTANKMGVLEIAQGPGFNYMLQLQNIFNNNISILPSGTPDKTQYLPFTLKKSEEKYYRSVSLIELSGEVFQCFLYKNANKPLPSELHEQTFNTLLQFLKGENRKIHFFFVDYERENNVDQDGYTQSNYLNSAATFFNNKDYNIFGKHTDAIYVVVTKSDLMQEKDGPKTDQVREYLKGNNFISFINSLKAKSKEHSINGGKIIAIPFSLGGVYFAEICDLKEETAKNVIDILLRRIPQDKRSILDVFNK